MHKSTLTTAELTKLGRDMSVEYFGKNMFRKYRNLKLGSEDAYIWSCVQRVKNSGAGFKADRILELGSKHTEFWSLVRSIQKSGSGFRN